MPSRAAAAARLAILLPTGLGLLAVLGTFVGLALSGRQAALDEARERAVALAAMAAEHAGRLMDASSLVLAEVAGLASGREWAEIEASEAGHLRLRELVERRDYLQALWLTDRDGMPRLTSRAFPAPAIPSGDREYFIRAAAGAPGPFLSRLLRSRVTGQTNIVMALRLPAPVDGFQGIAQAVIEPDYFFDLYERVGRDPGTEIMLVRDDAAVVLRHPRLPDETALELTFVQLAAVADYRSPADGLRRIGAVAPVSGYPMVVVVGVARDAVLAGWWRTTLGQGAYASMAAAGILLFGIASHRRRAEERRHAAELERRIAERTEELRHALAARELLLRELNHRVKNNLQLVISLLRIESSGSRAPGVKALVANTAARVSALADVHAMLYRSDRLDRLDAAEYLEELCGDLAASFAPQAGDEVALQVTAEPCWLDVERAIPLGLIVNELVTKAYRHAIGEPGAGAIQVRLQPVPADGWRLEVELGHPGRPVAWDEGTGMALVRAFARQLGGSVRLEGGARVVLDLPWPAAADGARNGTPAPALD